MTMDSNLSSKQFKTNIKLQLKSHTKPHVHVSEFQIVHKDQVC